MNRIYRMDKMGNVISDYKCSVRKPDDFDEFWGNVLDEAARIPLNAETVRCRCEVRTNWKHSR